MRMLKHGAEDSLPRLGDEDRNLISKTSTVSFGMTAGSPSVANTTPAPAPAAAPMAARLPPPATAPTAAPMPLPIPIFAASLPLVAFACKDAHPQLSLLAFPSGSLPQFASLMAWAAKPIPAVLSALSASFCASAIRPGGSV